MRKLGLFFRDWWFARCRRLDIEILWPECKRNSKGLDRARVAFAYHAAHDSAWQDLPPDHARQIIESLE